MPGVVSAKGSAIILIALLILGQPTVAQPQIGGTASFEGSFCRAVEARPTPDNSAIEIYTSSKAYTVDAAGIAREVPKNPSVVVTGAGSWFDFRTSEITKQNERSYIQFDVLDPDNLLSERWADELTSSELLVGARAVYPNSAISNDIPFEVPAILRAGRRGMIFVSLVGRINIERQTLTIDDVSTPGETSWFSDRDGFFFARLDYGVDRNSPEQSKPLIRFRTKTARHWAEPIPVSMSPYSLIPVDSVGASDFISIGRIDEGAASVNRLAADGSLVSVMRNSGQYDVARAVYNEYIDQLFVELDDSDRSQFINGQYIENRRVLYTSAKSELEIGAVENADGLRVSVNHGDRIAQTFQIRCAPLGASPAINTGSADGITSHRYMVAPNPTGRGDMILTVPPDPSPRGLVVQLKGGPWTHDSVGRNDETLWLTNQGFAVLQVNYSGSSGLGGAFERSVFLDNGRSAGEDVLAAIRWAQSYLEMTPAQTGMVATSYGGLLALRDVLPARVATAAWALKYPAFDYPYGRYRLGQEAAIETIDGNLHSWCTTRQFESERQKITVFVGENDRVVDPATAERFRLGCSGRVETEVVVLPGAGHGVGTIFSPELGRGMARLFGRNQSATRSPEAERQMRTH